MTRICADDMPDEIWLRIFQTCVQLYRAPDDNPFAKPCPNAKLPCTPFLLSAVCSDWRKISLSNSTLWSTVFIVLVGTSAGRQDSKLRIEAMELWIQRARSLPLSITFRVHARPDDFYQSADGMRLLALLVKHAQKIKELYMELPQHWYQTVTGVHFPILERLKVIVPEVEADFGSMTIMNEGPRTVYEGRRWAMDTEVVDFSQCPILSTASVTGPFAHNLIILPWENIVNLRVSHVVAGDIPGILRRFPAVKQFWVEFSEVDTMDDDSDFGDHSSDDEDLGGSSTLEKLVLEGVRSWALADILGDVPQSSLKHLEITLAEHEYEIEDEEFQESELFQPILKLADTLQHLSIGLDKVESLNSTIRFLSSFQSLVSLELLPASAELGLDDAFFKSLLMKPDTLSHLEDITISDLAISIEDGTLLDILRHRGYGGQLGTHTTAVGSSRLKSLRLVAQSGIESQSALLLEDSTRADLMRMVKEGLSIHIEFGEDVLFC